jgi:DNA-binding IclR family transcriptional regulator
VEDGFVTPGFASVAHAVFDHGGRPLAAISVTLRHPCPTGSGGCGQDWPELAARVRIAAEELTTAVGGRRAS